MANQLVVQEVPQSDKEQAFNELYERVLTESRPDNQGIPIIPYNLPYPKEDFLNFLVVRKNILLHGTSALNIEALEPREASDGAKASGNQTAVYAVADPVLAIFYAIQDRTKLQGVIQSGVEIDADTQEANYIFRLPSGALQHKPWTRGVVYILDKSQFSPEHDDAGALSGEWVSPQSVGPLAQLEVGPEDFTHHAQVTESSQPNS